jgi:hypothetical protein
MSEEILRPVSDAVHALTRARSIPGYDGQKRLSAEREAADLLADLTRQVRRLLHFLPPAGHQVRSNYPNGQQGWEYDTREALEGLVQKASAFVAIATAAPVRGDKPLSVYAPEQNTAVTNAIAAMVEMEKAHQKAWRLFAHGLVKEAPPPKPNPPEDGNTPPQLATDQSSEEQVSNPDTTTLKEPQVPREAVVAADASQIQPASEPAGGSPLPEQPNSMRLSGANWEAQYGDEKGTYPAKDYSSLAIVAKLLACPHQSFSLSELSAGGELLGLPEATDVLLDDPAIKDLKRRYDEEMQTPVPNDPLAKKERRDRLAQIAAELKKAMSPKGRRRKLGRTNADKAWDALTKNLRRLWPRLAETRMPGLAAHLERFVQFDKPLITYHPSAGTPPFVITQ